MIETVKVSSKGQIVIPESLRKIYKIKEGTKLVLIEKGNKIIVEQEKDFLKELDELSIEKEELGWLLLSENSLKDVWDNPKDDEVWSKYL